MTETGFGELLRRYRSEAGLTQQDLAERAGLSARGISDLERGARGLPREDTVRLLVEALGLTEMERAALISGAKRRPPPFHSTDERVARGLPVPLTSLVG